MRKKKRKKVAIPPKRKKPKRRSNERKVFNDGSKGKIVTLNDFVPKYKKWTCPKCGFIHHGFKNDVCRNEECDYG